MFIAVRDGKDDYSLWTPWAPCKYSQRFHGYRRSRFRFKPETGKNPVCTGSTGYWKEGCQEPYCQKETEKCLAKLYQTTQHENCKWTNCRSKTVCHNRYSPWKGYGIRKLVSRTDPTKLCSTQSQSLKYIVFCLCSRS